VRVLAALHLKWNRSGRSIRGPVAMKGLLYIHVQQFFTPFLVLLVKYRCLKHAKTHPVCASDERFSFVPYYTVCFTDVINHARM